MEIRVGQTLKFRGAEWICTRIEVRELEEFAGCSSADYASLYVSELGCQDLDRQIDEFSRNDIVKMVRHEVILEQPGYSRFTIRTKFHVKKVASISIPEGEQSGILSDSTNEPAQAGGSAEQVADVCGSVGTPAGDGGIDKPAAG